MGCGAAIGGVLAEVMPVNWWVLFMGIGVTTSAVLVRLSPLRKWRSCKDNHANLRIYVRVVHA